VAVIAGLGLPGQDERLGGLVLDAGAVGAYLRHVEDGVVLGDGGGVVLPCNVDEGQFLAHADLEGAVGGLGEGGLVGFGGGPVFAASVEGIPQRLLHVSGDDRPGGKIGAVLFSRRQRFACTRQSLGQQEVAIMGQVAVGMGGEKITEGVGGTGVVSIAQVGRAQAKPGLRGGLLVEGEGEQAAVGCGGRLVVAVLHRPRGVGEPLAWVGCGGGCGSRGGGGCGSRCRSECGRGCGGVGGEEWRWGQVEGQVAG